jgi:hypothetical protein
MAGRAADAVRTAPVQAEDDPEAFLDAALYARPSGVPGDPLSLRGFRWCRRQWVRWDILTRFAQAGDGAGPAGDAYARYAKWCPEAGDSEEIVLKDALGPSLALGIGTVREAVGEARARNPLLVMRPEFESRLSPGGDAFLSEAEAREILDYLGILPAADAGSASLTIRDALLSFQRAAGIPGTGETDTLTAGLMRNSLFLRSVEPISFLFSSEVSPLLDWDGGLDPVLYARPPSGASGAVLPAREFRWCQRQLVWRDITRVFSPDWDYSFPDWVPEARHAKWCGGAEAKEGLTMGVFLGPARRAGVRMLRELLGEMRIRNPRLAVRPGYVDSHSPGGVFEVSPDEAANTLEELGMLDASRDPVALAEALRRFQGEVGIPETGVPDAGTAVLLRSSLFCPGTGLCWTGIGSRH